MSSRFNLVIVIFVCTLSLAQAVDLVIARDHRSFWAQNISTNATTMSFVSNDSGKSTNVPLQEIDIVVPGVERGKKYSDDDVDAALQIVLNARARHNSLMKQLKILQNEWEAVRPESDAEIGQKIAEAMASFKSNKNSRAAYSDAMLSFSMLRCKDVTGVHSSQLDNAVGSVQEVCFGVNISKIEAMANAAKMTPDDFVKIKKPATVALKKEISQEDRKLLLAALEKARATTLNQGLAEAGGAPTDKSIDSYLKSRAILAQLKKDVAETAGEKFAVEKALSSLVMSAKSALPDYELGNNGYPLSRKDRDMLAATQAYSSTQLIFGTPVDEHCLIIINDTPKPFHAGNQAVIPMTLVFNCLWQNSKEYCMVVSGVGGKESEKRREKLPHLSVINGHADLPFSLDLSNQPQDIKPLRDGDGAYVLIYLACRPFSDDKKKEDAEWKAISLACRIPVAE